MSKKTSILVLTSAAFDAGIIALNKAANHLEAQVQLLLASAVYFAVKDGNTTPLNHVFTAVGRSVRKQAMTNWVLKYAPVVLNDNKETAKEQPFKFSADKLAALDLADRSAKTSEAHAMAAHAVMWTDYKEPPLVPETWSLGEAIKKVLTTAKGMQTKGVKITNGDLLQQLEALVPKASGQDGVASV